MNDIETMRKVNNIFLEGILNRSLDLFEGTELINTSFDLFNPEYMYESEELDDEEKAKKEKAKETKKKIIKTIAIITSLLAALIFIEKIYKSNKPKNDKADVSINDIKKLRNELNNNKKELKRIFDTPDNQLTESDNNKCKELINNISNLKLDINNKVQQAKKAAGKNDSHLVFSFGNMSKKLDEHGEKYYNKFLK